MSNDPIITPSEPIAIGAPVQGGTPGSVLEVGSDGNLSQGAGTSPGGSTTQVQFNDSGSFAGDSSLYWDKTNKVLTVGAPASVPTVANKLNIYDNTNVSGLVISGKGVVTSTATEGVMMGLFYNANGDRDLFFADSKLALAQPNTVIVFNLSAGKPNIGAKYGGNENSVPLYIGSQAVVSNPTGGAQPALIVCGDCCAGGVGFGFRCAEGSNAKMGTAVLSGGTVVVSDTVVTATSRILLTCQAPGGTPGAVYVSARTAGTSFTITSTSGSDTSTIAYLIVEPY